LIELICLGEVGKDWEGTNTAVFEAERWRAARLRALNFHTYYR
jgi:hypothetical protein